MTYRFHLLWRGGQSRPCYKAMHNMHVVLTSACGVRPNRLSRVTEMTRVKSSKVGTIMPRSPFKIACDHRYYRLCRLGSARVSNKWSSGSLMQGMVPQGSKEVASGDCWKQRPLQVAKQHCDANGNAELQGEVN